MLLKIFVLVLNRISTTKTFFKISKEFNIAINKKILSILTKLLINKNQALINADLAFNIIAFKHLISIINILAIRLIKKK